MEIPICGSIRHAEDFEPPLVFPPPESDPAIRPPDSLYAQITPARRREVAVDYLAGLDQLNVVLQAKLAATRIGLEDALEGPEAVFAGQSHGLAIRFLEDDERKLMECRARWIAERDRCAGEVGVMAMASFERIREEFVRSRVGEGGSRSGSETEREARGMMSEGEEEGEGKGARGVKRKRGVVNKGERRSGKKA